MRVLYRTSELFMVSFVQTRHRRRPEPLYFTACFLVFQHLFEMQMLSSHTPKMGTKNGAMHHPPCALHP